MADEPYKAKGSFLSSLFATLPTSGDYSKKLSEYSYSGGSNYFVTGKSSSSYAWGLIPDSKQPAYQYVGLYKKGGSAIGFASKSSSIVPKSTGYTQTAKETRTSSPFEGIGAFDGSSSMWVSTYCVWNGSDSDSKCYVSSDSDPASDSGKITVAGDGVWLFLQAPGGGGGECYNTYSSDTGFPAGSGGGGGASALVYLPCRNAHSDALSAGKKHDYSITINKPGSAGTKASSSGTRGTDGTDGGSITVNRYFGTATSTVLTVLGGSKGVNGTYKDGDGYSPLSKASGGAGGKAPSVIHDSNVFVVGSFDGGTGGNGYRKYYTTEAEGDPGSDMTAGAQAYPFGDGFYLVRNPDSKSGGTMWGRGMSAKFFQGNGTGNVYTAGGGGGAACSCCSYVDKPSDKSSGLKSIGYVPDSVSAGHGGNGGEGAQQATAGGVGRVVVLMPYVDGVTASGSGSSGGSSSSGGGSSSGVSSLSSPVLSHTAKDLLSYYFTIKNSNSVAVTAHYYVTSGNEKTVSVAANGSATTVTYPAGTTLYCYFTWGSLTSGTDKDTIPSSGSVSPLQ